MDHRGRGGLMLNSLPAVLGVSSAPKSVVTGGTLYSDSTYYYRVFTSTGTLSISGGALSADALVIAGGGGGGYGGGGGGGGAGGLSFLTAGTFAVNSYTCTIGAGGALNTNGNNATLNSITSIGGGAGGNSAGGGNGNSGGSGGGGNADGNGSGGSSTQTNSGGATGYG